MIKILHVFDHSIPLHSGYTFRSMSILMQQAKMGWVTEHVTSSKHNISIHTENDEEIIDGLHFYRTNSKSGLLYKLPILNQAAIVIELKKRLHEIIKLFKPDIIHAHSPLLNGKAAVSVAKTYKIPVVYEIRAFWEDAAVDHGTTKENSLRYKASKMLETNVVRNADAVMTICEGLKKDLIKRGIPESKLTVIPNAVDVEEFPFDVSKDPELLEKLGLNNKDVIGFVGSFYAYEGITLILDALHQLVKENCNIRLLLVGGGPEEANIRNKVDELKLKEYVVMTGRVSHSDVQKYYSLIDICVYPRLPMRLTDIVTPLKPLEAMALGKMVVASDVGGHKELIKSGETGDLFPANNITELARCITNLYLKKENWHVRKLLARKFVEEQRNWTSSVERYKPVYQKLLGR